MGAVSAIVNGGRPLHRCANVCVQRAKFTISRLRGLTRHDLRHEFASHLVGEGGEIREAKEAVRQALGLAASSTIRS